MLPMIAKTVGGVISKAIAGSNMYDPFDGRYHADRVLQPPYPLTQLAMLPAISDTLGQCIKASVDNICGLGWELATPEHLKGDNIDQPEAEAEYYQLQTFFTKGCHPRLDFTEILKRVKDDEKRLGNGYLEIVRDLKGRIAELYPLPGHTMRITPSDKEWTPYRERIRDAKGVFIEQPRMRKFRRFVQIVDGQKVYFKEFGDPRKISKSTGQVAKNPRDEATEVIHFAPYCSYSPYGIPQHIGVLPDILGAWKAAEVNFRFFDNNAIPAMVVLLSGASLTPESRKELEDMIQRDLRGVESFNKWLILEAQPFDIGDDLDMKLSPVKVDFKPMTQHQEKDANFREYRRDVSDAVRSVFRLAPIYVGRSDDYTRATALESIRVTENHVFEPERQTMAKLINRTILADMQINYWDWKLLGANTSDDTAMVTALSTVQQAVPVGTIIQAVMTMLNEPMPDIPEEWHTMPLAQLLSRSMLGEWPPDDEAEDDAPPNPDNVEKLAKIMVDLRTKLLKKSGTYDGDDF